MNYREIEEWYNGVCRLLEQQRVLDALDKIAVIAMQKGNTGHLARMDELRFTYGNMLSYTVKGVADPQRDLIYNRLLVSVYELADNLRMDLISRTSLRTIGMKHELEREMRQSSEDMAESLLGLSFDHELEEMLRSTVLFDDETESETAVQHRNAIIRAFQLLWLTHKLTEDDSARVLKIFDSTSIPWYEKSMLVSALTLGMLRCFDYRKLELLIRLYDEEDYRISQRALVGLIVAISIYNNRILLYPALMERLFLLRGNERFATEAESVMIQLIRSKDTEKITRKFREEIIPDVIRFNEDLSEKLNLDKLMSPEEFQDKNPDWEKYFDNQPGLVRKLEELTNMQMEGADVFLGAFAMLKSFPFFSELPNWFMPFYKEHYAIVNALKGEEDPFKKTLAEGIERSVFMCNSDKFSFILNIANMPDAQKGLIGQMFSAEAEQYEELLSEEANDPSLRSKRVVIQYIQDLYRFFRLHPLRSEMGDIFSLPLEFHLTSIFDLLVNDTARLKAIASFYFDNDHYDEALRIYQLLEMKGESYAELFEKSGYCCQQKGDYQDAIDCYRKADLFDTNRAWLLGKIAQCHLKLSDTRAALETYLELNSLETDNLKTAAAIGTCYLNLNEPAKALDYFYRIEFADQGSARAMRPVAWCLLVLGRTDEAAPYYQQLLGLEPNAYDYINAGHLAFCRGDKQQAAEYYISSIRKREGDLRSFLKGFNADRNVLIRNGVDKDELPLMMDYIRFRVATG
ncbi:tetratricopeptide repeat protein [Lentimicrobium sp.]|uniref:tetratricopeptide repeat protein n=1 Tax=Lentimicrobium sp. TaxID=2034841 RepID=UPI0026014EA3|nr:tetratricopeptide repeat protein [Lentimicrobium sp.]MCO5257464.1 tetratricopeptide repeat protein [Lentimicrobium sp.]MCO5262579.1 tetratricopeptide repeat protein [Lentimicrobium sp.]HOP14392.1 tetratricopeptide repeat protein [Lentimicrobium sp.]HPF65177.1 tetratricopeptide repeat protein [Lentimicrobium sp.]HPJ62679.1 tetratricopeptide repeat protein [Lentimicrobium sp.]